jgi:hypothetical protein
MNKINTLDNIYIQKSTKFMNILQQFINKKGSNAIFGAGSFGLKVYEKLQEIDYPIECFFDNDENKDNSVIDDVKVYSSKKLANNISTLIIASTWYYDIVKQLKKENVFKGNIIIIDPWLDIFNLNLTIDDFIKLNKFYKKLSDSESKDTLINIINSRVSFNSVVESLYPQYFNPNVEIKENYVFLDGGAYNGVKVCFFSKSLLFRSKYCLGWRCYNKYYFDR